MRDLLLGRDPIDIDLVVVGDAAAAARTLAERLGGDATEHERFGTATVAAPGLPAINVVRARRESYAQPGALPDVEPGTLEEDLARRDFTVNALALALDGRITAVPDGLEDLDEGLIRVLHEASFRDDPTRLLRAVRYATRLGFALERHTEALAREAAAAGRWRPSRERGSATSCWICCARRARRAAWRSWRTSGSAPRCTSSRGASC